jgi:predicted transcriptional regulator
MRLFKKKPAPLGHLEECVMEILWLGGESNVRDLAEKLARPLAYTTVMTTLDRLYKKGLLARRKEERAFLYAPRLSRLEWERELMAGFSGELLISCFLDNAEHDPALLDELERKIRMKRKELRKS